VDALRDRLVEIAARGDTITYEQLRAELGLSGDLVPLLRALSIDEDESGRGLLTAVVVQSDSGMPGGGWFRLAEARGRSGSDLVAMWNDERTRLREIHRR